MKIADLKDWLDERLSISTLAAMADKKEVPLHRHSIWYYWLTCQDLLTPSVT